MTTLYRLPPAGNRIPWSHVVDEAAVRGLFLPWEAAFFNSGTAALAALLVILRDRVRGRDEVVLAAYNCPGMISAIQYAGCVPRLVDLLPGRPWMDGDGVARALSPRTLAIVGVDMFGIPERYGILRELADRHGCFLVQDSAQGFPKRAGDVAWHGDAVVLSFGRGKPVSLLAGGAVLCRDRALAHDVAAVAQEEPDEMEPYHRRRVQAYNLLRTPRLYWLPAAIPALHLGETRFEPLAKVTGMSPWLKCRVPAAVAAYRSRVCGAEAKYAAMGFRHGLIDVARHCGLPKNAPLSRYPLLARDELSRDRLCNDLREYGVSCFYGTTLPEVAGLEEMLGSSEPFPNARNFAARLFTLPTHDGVRQRDVVSIGRTLGAVMPPTLRAIREPVA